MSSKCNFCRHDTLRREFEIKKLLFNLNTKPSRANRNLVLFKTIAFRLKVSFEDGFVSKENDCSVFLKNKNDLERILFFENILNDLKFKEKNR